MDPFSEFIDLSDGDGIGADESPFNFDDFLAENNIPTHVEAMNITQDVETGPNGYRSLVGGYQSCLESVLDVFPDISHDHVQQIYNEQMKAKGSNGQHEDMVAPSLIEKILDGGVYPKERDRIRELKRKRSDKDVDEEEAAKWKYMDLRDDPTEYAKVAKVALQEAFEYVPIKFIHDQFKQHGHYYGAFFAILKAEREYNPPTNVPFSRLKARRVSNGPDSKMLMANFQIAGHDFEALKKEMDSAFQRRKREDVQRQASLQAEQAEAARDQVFIANGEVMDCGCCCETVTIPRMTYCNGDEPHFFCLDCARRNANNDIGNSQYKLKCMDFSDCDATFSREQRLRFLDEKTIEKLERLQQQEELRLAELDNLSSCPFCDFAAICPPIEEDREFRCHNPECYEVSCRSCKLKSHVPLTCEEHKKENGISERRVIEEARTEALIRTCNKCKVRILKEDGCNKVVCTSCYAVLCDYCGKDITKVMYNHFDSENTRVPPGLISAPGGKCPLYDESNKRKDQQVDAAEKSAMAEVRAKHPELSEEDLRIKFAKSVQQSSHSHRDRHRPPFAIPPPPHFVHQHDGLRDPALPFGAGFIPRHANVQAEAAAAVPEALPAGLEAARRQQQAAYHAYMQLQQQRHLLQQQRQQAEQQIEQMRVQEQAHFEQQFEQLRAQQQVRQAALDQQMGQLRARQQARLQQHPQQRNDENQAPNLNPRAPNMPFGPDGFFDARQPAENGDPLAFNDFGRNDLLRGPNQNVLNPFAPRGRPRGELRTRHPAPQAHNNVEGAARHAQQGRQQQQSQPPRAPIRRNAAGYVDVRTGQAYPLV